MPESSDYSEGNMVNERGTAILFLLPLTPLSATKYLRNQHGVAGFFIASDMTTPMR